MQLQEQDSSHLIRGIGYEKGKKQTNPKFQLLVTKNYHIYKYRDFHSRGSPALASGGTVWSGMGCWDCKTF